MSINISLHSNQDDGNNPKYESGYVLKSTHIFWNNVLLYLHAAVAYNKIQKIQKEKKEHNYSLENFNISDAY